MYMYAKICQLWIHKTLILIPPSFRCIFFLKFEKKKLEVHCRTLTMRKKSLYSAPPPGGETTIYQFFPWESYYGGITAIQHCNRKLFFFKCN